MLPDALITHRTAERLRIRIPSRKRDADYFSSLTDHLSRYPGIDRIEANPLTGSVLLLHRMDLGAFGEYSAANRLFRLKTAASSPSPIHRKMLEPLNRLDGDLKKFTGGEIDLSSIVFIGLLGMGFYQISIGNITAPAWYTAFWYAMNTAFKAQSGSKQ